MNELIQELTKKGKYDEWVSYGSYFGQTSHIFDIKQYKYYDMDGDIISVSRVSKFYRRDVLNTPVFKQYYVKDPSYVTQATYRFNSISEELSTSGLATCCGLAIMLRDKKFLAHLDTSMKNKIASHITKSYYESLDIKLTSYDRDMVDILKKEVEKEVKNEVKNEVPNPIKATIYAANIYSNLYSDLSVKKAKKICAMVGITDITMVYVDMFDRVTI